MQHEVDTLTHATPIHLLGVNAVGSESGNALISEGRSIPWLQDADSVRAWLAWEVEWRDLVILDSENRVIRVYNLTEHSLLEPANYAELRSILLDAAR